MSRPRVYAEQNVNDGINVTDGAELDMGEGAARGNGRDGLYLTGGASATLSGSATWLQDQSAVREGRAVHGCFWQDKDLPFCSCTLVSWLVAVRDELVKTSVCLQFEGERCRWPFNSSGPPFRHEATGRDPVTGR
jgi:hypothetical protein